MWVCVCVCVCVYIHLYTCVTRTGAGSLVCTVTLALRLIKRPKGNRTLPLLQSCSGRPPAWCLCNRHLRSHPCFTALQVPKWEAKAYKHYRAQGHYKGIIGETPKCASVCTTPLTPTHTLKHRCIQCIHTHTQLDMQATTHVQSSGEWWIILKHLRLMRGVLTVNYLFIGFRVGYLTFGDIVM